MEVLLTITRAYSPLTEEVVANYRNRTMNDFHVGTPQPEGSLFRFNSDLSRHFIKDKLSIPNGIGWSQDDKTMYFVSSTDKNLLAFDYDSTTGNVSNERIFWTLEGEGDPDGFAMDSEVCECFYV